MLRIRSAMPQTEARFGGKQADGGREDASERCRARQPATHDAQVWLASASERLQPSLVMDSDSLKLMVHRGRLFGVWS